MGIVQFLYIIFLGVLIAVVVGVGIYTFYAPPSQPEQRIELNTYGKEPTDEQVIELQRYEREQIEYQKAMQPYNRNVSIMSLVAAILLLSLSVVASEKIHTISDGIMVGGLGLLVYSIGRGFASGDTQYVFMVATAGLIVVLFLGYRWFVRSKRFNEELNFE